MQRLRRVFDIALSICPRCGGSVNVLAVITEPALIASIPGHLASILGHLAKREARARPVVVGAERDRCRTGGQESVRRGLVHKPWAFAIHATAA